MWAKPAKHRHRHAQSVPLILRVYHCWRADSVDAPSTKATAHTPLSLLRTSGLSLSYVLVMALAVVLWPSPLSLAGLRACRVPGHSFGIPGHGVSVPSQSLGCRPSVNASAWRAALLLLERGKEKGRGLQVATIHRAKSLILRQYSGHNL